MGSFRSAHKISEDSISINCLTKIQTIHPCIQADERVETVEPVAFVLLCSTCAFHISPLELARNPILICSLEYIGLNSEDGVPRGVRTNV